MNIRQLVSCLFLIACTALAQELPLPMSGPLPDRSAGQNGLVRPNAVIRPPGTGPVKTAPAMVFKPPGTEIIEVPVEKPAAPGNDVALLEKERQLVEQMVRERLAEAHQTGHPVELRRLIVMNGPVDSSVSFSPKPPTAAEGRVALIGLEPHVAVAKDLEGFFGVPFTPDRQKRLLETVQSQLATAGPMVEVRLAGWWPEEGVMAVSVVPKG